MSVKSASSSPSYELYQVPKPNDSIPSDGPLPMNDGGGPAPVATTTSKKTNQVGLTLLPAALCSHTWAFLHAEEKIRLLRALAPTQFSCRLADIRTQAMNWFFQPPSWINQLLAKFRKPAALPTPLRLELVDTVKGSLNSERKKQNDSNAEINWIDKYCNKSRTLVNAIVPVIKDEGGVSKIIETCHDTDALIEFANILWSLAYFTEEQRKILSTFLIGKLFREALNCTLLRTTRDTIEFKKIMACIYRHPRALNDFKLHALDAQDLNSCVRKICQTISIENLSLMHQCHDLTRRGGYRDWSHSLVLEKHAKELCEHFAKQGQISDALACAPYYRDPSRAYRYIYTEITFRSGSLTSSRLGSQCRWPDLRMSAPVAQ